MPKLRQDPTTGEWVIFATERSKRPHDLTRHVAPAKTDLEGTSCPFCPGNEAETPPAVLTIPETKGTDWEVRVVPNRFPAVSPTTPKKPKPMAGIFREVDSVGTQEVIIETPDHNQTLATMEARNVLNVLKAYRQRYSATSEDPRIKFVLIFKNHGESAGTSLSHSHSQLLASTVVPTDIERRFSVAKSYLGETGKCLYSKLVKEELKAKKRVISQSGNFLVFHPYASRFPFETWVAPMEQVRAFGAVSDAELEELAEVLKSALSSLRSSLEDPDYNLILHSGPVGKNAPPPSFWYFQIIPRLTKLAGFELGSGTTINTMLPEATATFMRKRR